MQLLSRWLWISSALKEDWLKYTQIGNVIIGTDVEIGVPLVLTGKI
jgi:UDP-3-O-[3-hydroxymyristoyl] glucosamine N-acyltransferase